MTDAEQLDAIRAAVAEVIGQAQALPIQSAEGNVTEIYIRVGQGGSVRLGGTTQDPPPCEKSAEVVLSDELAARIEALAQRTGMSVAALLRQLEGEARARLLEEAIRNLEDSVS